MSSLRIYAKIDEVMALLAYEMELQLRPNKLYEPRLANGSKVGTDRFTVPYDKNGRKSASGETTLWDLRVGAKVQVTAGPGKGFKGEICGKNKEGHYQVKLPIQREGDPSHGKGQRVYILGK